MELLETLHCETKGNSCIDLIYVNLLSDKGFDNRSQLSDYREELACLQELQPVLYTYFQANRDFLPKAYISYLVVLAHRLHYMHCLLKDTGSLYLHCDDTMSHYIKILLDIIFGIENYQNQIIWQRTSAHNDPGRYGRIADTLFFYSKNKKFTYFKTQYTPYSREYLDKFYRHQDNKGRYRLSDLTGPGINAQDEAWHGYHPAERGRSWSIPKEALRRIISEKERQSLTTIQKLELLYTQGLIEISSKGTPAFKRYLDTMEGIPLQNIWTDISSDEPYTPEVLLERIIESSCPQDGIIAGFFSSGGTDHGSIFCSSVIFEKNKFPTLFKE